MGVIFLSEVIRTAQFHAFVPEIGVRYQCNSIINHSGSSIRSHLSDISLALCWCFNKQNHVIVNAHIIQHINPQQKWGNFISKRLQGFSQDYMIFLCITITRFVLENSSIFYVFCDCRYLYPKLFTAAYDEKEEIRSNVAVNVD